MSVANTASSSGVAQAAPPALANLQSAARILGSGGSPAAATAETIVNQANTTTATGITTTLITYANGTTATTTSYGPPPASTLSVLV